MTELRVSLRFIHRVKMLRLLLQTREWRGQTYQCTGAHKPGGDHDGKALSLYTEGIELRHMQGEQATAFTCGSKARVESGKREKEEVQEEK